MWILGERRELEKRRKYALLTTRGILILCVSLLGLLAQAGCTLGGDATTSDGDGDNDRPNGIAEAPAWVKAACNTLTEPGRADDSVEAAYETNAGLVALWEGLRGGLALAAPSSYYNAFPPGHPVAVCYVTGDFPAPGPGPLEGESPWPPYDRAIFLFPQGAQDPLPPIVYGSIGTLSIAADGPPPVDTPAAAN